MRSNILDIIKKQWLIIWIIAASMMLITIVASAESFFTLSPLKRVLVSKDGHGLLFSSNILEKPEGGSISYIPSYKTGDAPYNADLYLWNFDTKDEGSRYTEDINYKLEAKFTDTEGNDLNAEAVGARTVVITPTVPSGSALTLSSESLSGELTGQTLAYSDSSSTENAYTITFTGWSLDDDTDICVQIRAIPTQKNSGEAYTDLSEIARIVGLRKARVSGSNGWKANISEMTSSNTPTDFDAYNLIVSGSGKATITISWDTTKLDVNKNFYTSTDNVFGYIFSGEEAEIVDGGVSDGWRTITINADTSKVAQNNRNRYTLQLYKTGVLDDKTYPADWDTLFAKNLTAAESPNAWLRVSIE